MYIWGISCVEGVAGIHPYIPTSGSTESITETSVLLGLENNVPVSSRNMTYVFDIWCTSGYTDNVPIIDILGEATNGESIGGMVLTNANTVSCFSVGGSQRNLNNFDQASSYVDNGMNRFAIVYDKSNGELRGYINGELFDTEDFTPSDLSFPYDGYFRFGKWSTYMQPRQIKNFKIFHHAATSDEAASWGGPK